MLAILSDIHANREALAAVLSQLRRLKPDKIICLGDIVGYGPDPEWCVDTVLRVCNVVLCGNHDFALVHGADTFTDAAQAALDYHRQLLMPRWNESPDEGGRQRRWNALKLLRHRHTEDSLLFVHASPRNPLNEYLREREVRWGAARKLNENFSLMDWLAFVGHTHRAGVITSAPEFLSPPQIDHLYRAMPGRKAIINVGSVGQPRDGDPRAAFVTLQGPEVRFHRAPYDVETTIRKIEADGILDFELAERLRSGV